MGTVILTVMTSNQKAREDWKAVMRTYGRNMKNSIFIPSYTFVERIRRFYGNSFETNMSDKDSLWDFSKETMASKYDVHLTLINGNHQEVKELLSDPCSTDLFYGADSAAKSIASPVARDWSMSWLQHYTISLAIDLGIIKRTHEYAKVSLDKFDILISKAEELYSHNSFLWKKFFKSETGFTLNEERLYCFRSINAFFHSIEVLNLLNSLSLSRVIEIGPGLGRTLINIFNHKTKLFGIDIPIGCVTQALYIAAALGENCISLGNESYDFTNTSTIHLLTPNFLPSINNNKTLILNVDSFTEIGIESMAKYANQITESGRCLLSINHERNEYSVYSAFKNINISPIARTKDHWSPYMRELYLFDN